ncbi:MAG: Glucosidase [Ferruginibacter sp.]|nr:Glucosidase [Ferruginibacter sp.]
MTIEESRIHQHYNNTSNWLKWGPYLSERQWGTVREDYSPDGDVWNYVTHDMARSKAYRWGEDGLAGFCDEQQVLCVSLALWNGKDPIIKERLFGLTNLEGNHGEDVKELYYYLDNVPTHSYNKMLYKYPQDAYPYDWIVKENGKRTKLDPEFELIDTGIFDDNRYFDVFVEYAKNDPDDILIKYTVHNRGTADSVLHLLPQFFYRNTWDWQKNKVQPLITYTGQHTMLFHSPELGNQYCYAEGDAEYLFTNNETNEALLNGGINNTPFCKDGFNQYLVHKNKEAINPSQEGTKAAIWFQLTVPAGKSVETRLRLTNKNLVKPFESFNKIFKTRISEADEFYKHKQVAVSSAEEKMVQRQAWAGMLWSKQFYNFNVNLWRNGDPSQPTPPGNHRNSRNKQWKHFVANDILSMPDKWEYPWFAAWDLAFHSIAFAPIDPDFAKGQLKLLLQVNYMHPNGQLPAYEWDFGDANPPVHAMAAWKIYQLDKKLKGEPDYHFLEAVFQKLLLNFTWWVNRKDSNGNNIFEGGFLGLDNIGIFNRSAPVPGGGDLEQADGTSWVAMYALNMVQIALELSLQNPVYESMAIKFSEHFLFIAGSITHMGEDSEGLWDDEDGFYYDLLKLPDGSYRRLKVRTMVGLIPMFATIIFNENTWESLPVFKEHMEKFSQQRPDLAALVSYWKDRKGNGEEHLLSLLRGHRLKLLLHRMLDPQEFLSAFGIRSVSKLYQDHPYELTLNGADYSVCYTPAESSIVMFGGNSNWRGPIWMPLNFLLVESLYNLHEYYSADFKVEYPTGSGEFYSLAEIAASLSQRIKSIFLRNEKGERPVFGGHPKINSDPHFKDYILFHEYFNGDTGKGLGASHQTGWTALVAVLDYLAMCK